MSEPTSTVSTMITVSPIVMGLFLPNIINPDALIGAFGGAVVFMMYARDLTLWQRLAYLIVSIGVGYRGYGEVLYHTPIQSVVIASFVLSLGIVFMSILVMDGLGKVDLPRLIARFTGGK